MTSAPRSASSRPPEGPATMWLSSRTRKPVSGRRPVPPVAASSVICDIFLQVVTTSVCPVARWADRPRSESSTRRGLLILIDQPAVKALDVALQLLGTSQRLVHPHLKRPAGTGDNLGRGGRADGAGVSAVGTSG